MSELIYKQDAKDAVDNGDWYQDANHCYMGGFVIAWMPMPEPYQPKEE